MNRGSDGPSLENAVERPDEDSSLTGPVDEAGATGGNAGASSPTGEFRTAVPTPTRISASWTAVVIAVFLLIVLVIFIAENTQRSTVNFVGFHGHAPTAVALLIAAIAGAGIVVIVGVARMLQLRKAARRSEARH